MPRIALTDRSCAAAKAEGDAQTDYFDALTTGLALRVAPSGRKVWTFLYTSPRDGKRSRLTLGTYPAVSLAAARGEAIVARHRVEQGDDPRTTDKGAGEITVAELVKLYLADPDKAQLRSAGEIKRRLEKDALPKIGAVKLAKLTRRDVRNVTEPIMKRGARVQAWHTHKDLHAILRWAVRNEYLEHNPIEGMEKPGGFEPGERVLSDDEIRTIWNGLPQSLAKSKACQRIVKLILVTGQRSGEVCGMAQSELDLQRKLWSLPGSRTKNAHPHTVPLSDLALGIIRDALADIDDGAEYLFPNDDGDGPLGSQALGRTIARANEASEDRPLGRFGIPHWSAHDLRRTALTGMAKLGVAPHTIAHVANHRSITKSGVTFAHYVMHSYEGEKRQALDLWAERLAAIVGSGGAAVVPMRRRGRAGR
jgi:integrase